MKRLKRLLFRLLGKDPEAVVVCFATGDEALTARMCAEVRELVPDRRHFVVARESGSTLAIWLRLRRLFRGYRIGLAPVLFTGDPAYRALRRAAWLLAPGKVLAYNARLERHHLRLRTAVASLLFLRGVPLDRIWLRPAWLFPWKRDRSVHSSRVREWSGRALSPSRRRLAVVSPYFPYPLSHGGAVRIFHLLREMAAEFDVFLLSFSEGGEEQCGPVLEHCARVIVVDKPRYREPRWATLGPTEVGEYASPAMRGALARILREFEIQLVQVEYTALAPYAGDVLVEHDVTFHLYEQVYRRAPSLSAWWDLWRWRRFERTWVGRYRRVVVMSDQDRARLGASHAAVIPNGVDLERFRPEIERPGHRLLFIGSFRHFPNVVAYRFFVEQVWPLLKQRGPDVRVTVVAGPEPELYWREQTGLLEFPADDRIAVTGFVADVRPLYVEANLVMVPTLVSAGTNLKVLEALAMERAVISTSSGCAGLGLEHGKNVWIADSDAAFADGIERLFTDRDLRERVAFAGRVHAEAHFGWPLIGRRQRALLRALLAPPLEIRRAAAADIPEILAIQSTAPEASQWTPEDYLTYDCHVAIAASRIGGFLVSRQLAPGEREILNVAVHPEKRRTGIASALIGAETERWPGVHFLEVRASNQAARRVYHMLGFEEISTRADYYDDPPEAGIVMRFRS